MSFLQCINNKAIALKMMGYRHIYIPYRTKQIRKKDVINVLFVVWSLGAWKSESVYKTMLSNPRFNPTLLIVNFCEEDDRENLRRYANLKNYPYQESDSPNEDFWERFHPDIIFFQKPYGGEFFKNLKSLFCYVPYATHGSLELQSIRTDYILNCWQVYYENEQLAHEYSTLLGRPIHNSYATGIPTMDELSVAKETLEDPWKRSLGKKRIIYAPHHSINLDNWWQTSTFLETGGIMLRLAKKYSDRVQWAFKPHPLLRGKLELIWGKKNTDEYYNEWAEPEWSQYVSGKYLGLFKYSNAMIHDCGSFMMEYHYTLNPVMYLGRDLSNNPTIKTLNSIQQKALSLHTIGISEEEIEHFILDVINERDPDSKLRQEYYDDFLLTPNRKSASQNIIDCILSKKSFRRF